jgi:glutathione S-transferase
MLVHPTSSNPTAKESDRFFPAYIGDKYAYTEEEAKAAPTRVAGTLKALGARLEQQRASGSTFFIGDQPSALDIYWGTFAALIQPLPHDLCPIANGFRTMYSNTDPVVQAAMNPILLEHRDIVYHDYLVLPIDL